MMAGESTAPCHCAGNLKFNSNHSQVIKVSNKSGDFLPENIQLNAVLAILVTLNDQAVQDTQYAHPLKLHDPLIIRHWHPRGKYSARLELLREFINAQYRGKEVPGLRASKAAQLRIVTTPAKKKESKRENKRKALQKRSPNRTPSPVEKSRSDSRSTSPISYEISPNSNPPSPPWGSSTKRKLLFSSKGTGTLPNVAGLTIGENQANGLFNTRNNDSDKENRPPTPTTMPMTP